MGLFLAPYSGNAVGGGGHGINDPPPQGVDVDAVGRVPLKLLRTTMNKHKPKFMNIVPPGLFRGALAPPYSWEPRERDDWEYRTPRRFKTEAAQPGLPAINPQKARIDAIHSQLMKLREEVRQLVAKQHMLVQAGKQHMATKPATPPPAGHWKGAPSDPSGYPGHWGAHGESLVRSGLKMLSESDDSTIPEFKKVPLGGYNLACPYCEQVMGDKDFSFKFDDATKLWEHCGKPIRPTAEQREQAANFSRMLSPVSEDRAALKLLVEKRDPADLDELSRPPAQQPERPAQQAQRAPKPVVPPIGVAEPGERAGHELPSVGQEPRTNTLFRQFTRDRRRALNMPLGLSQGRSAPPQSAELLQIHQQIMAKRQQIAMLVNQLKQLRSQSPHHESSNLRSGLRLLLM